METQTVNTKNAVHPEIFTVGEAMALFVAHKSGPLSKVADFHRLAAGADLNVAVGLSRLGFRVAYISRLGADALGQYLLNFMLSEGIDTRYVVIDERYPTGLMLKSLELNGEDPKTEYFRRGSAASHLSPTDLPLGAMNGVRHLHLTGVAAAVSDSLRELIVEMAVQARATGCTVSFDPNLRPSLWPSRDAMIVAINRLAAKSDLVMPGLAEGQLLTGLEREQDIADFYLQRGARQIVIKLGADGSYFASAQGSGYAKGLPVTKVVDTVGAGDGFAAGVVSALLDGLSLEAAAMRGNAIGARVVQFPGDSDGLPNRKQLEDMLKSAIPQ